MVPIVVAMLVFGSVLAAGVYMFRWQRKKSEAMLRDWAVRQHLQLLESERADPFGTGPMNRNAANKQIAYRVKVKDQMGEVRRGTVRLGRTVTGVISDHVSVDWDP